MSVFINSGSIREYGSKIYIEWKICNYFCFPQKVNNVIESESFSFCDEMWYLLVYPCGQIETDSPGWVSLYLKKQYSTSLQRPVNFKIGIRTYGIESEGRHSCKGRITSGKSLFWGIPKLCQQSELRNRKLEMTPYDTLTVFCKLQVINDFTIENFPKTSSLSAECKERIDRVIKFNPVAGIDTMMKKGVSTSITTLFQCIACMKEYENKSLEELRSEDYAFDLQKCELKSPGKWSSDFSNDTTSRFSRLRLQARRHSSSQPSGIGPTSFSFGASSSCKSTQTSSLTSFSFGPSASCKTTQASSPVSFSFGASASFKNTQASSPASFCFGASAACKTTQASSPTIFSFGPSASCKTTRASCPSSFSFGNTNQSCTSLTTTQAIKEKENVLEAESVQVMKDCGEENHVFAGLDKLSEDLKELYMNGEDTDVTFQVQDKEFKAHKTLLEARSPIFAKMFRHDMVENYELVEITDCNSDTFNDFLLYLYSGKIEIELCSFDRVLDLYVIADKYDVQILKPRCVTFMTHNLCIDNFCKVLTLAVRFKELALMESATSYFVKNVKDIIVTPDWINFQKENLIEANELHIKAINSLFPS